MSASFQKRVVGHRRPGCGFVNQHYNGIQVALVSLLILALMASGLNGQCCLHWLPPIGRRKSKTTGAEAESARRKQTQLFIETPYRNEKMFGTLLPAARRRCASRDITARRIIRRSISNGNRNPCATE
jgi:16S rRNA (cytidine1402-2'-O)-methyltransferase